MKTNYKKFCDYFSASNNSFDFASFKPDQFPDYANEFHFMRMPTGYQDDMENGTPIESKTYKIDISDEQLAQLKPLVNQMSDGDNNFAAFVRFFMALAKQKKIYNFYSIGMKTTMSAKTDSNGNMIADPNAKPEKIFLIRGCEKVYPQFLGITGEQDVKA